jgi:hypothetical protein
MGLKVTNNAFGTLNAGITNSDTTLVLQSGQGSRLYVQAVKAKYPKPE